MPFLAWRCFRMQFFLPLESLHVVRDPLVIAADNRPNRFIFDFKAQH